MLDNATLNKGLGIREIFPTRVTDKMKNPFKKESTLFPKNTYGLKSVVNLAGETDHLYLKVALLAIKVCFPKRGAPLDTAKAEAFIRIVWKDLPVIHHSTAGYSGLSAGDMFSSCNQCIPKPFPIALFSLSVTAFLVIIYLLS